MLKVNVGLSRKLSRDYNSTGFSINVEGEICASIDDPEAVVEKVKELYDLAEEALNHQIERYEGESAIANRDREPVEPPRNGSSRNGDSSHREERRNNDAGRSRQGAGDGETATNKQIQYLLNLGKRHGLTPQQLESRIESTFGRQIGVYQLTKREAGELIDSLTQDGAGGGQSNGRQRCGRN